MLSLIHISCEVMGAPAYLSGAGPTLMALCREANADEFISRITPVLADWGNWRICKLPPDNLGARVETL